MHECPPTSKVWTVLALALAILVPAGASAAAQPVSPRRLVLRLTDLPEPFIGGGHFNSNTTVSDGYHLSAAGLAQKGRITSYETDFSPRYQPLRVSITNEVIAYRTPAGARWEYAYRLGLARAYFQKTNVSFPVSLDAVGDERSGFGVSKRLTTGSVPTVAGKKKHPTLVTTDVIFQRGNYVAQIAIADLTGRYGAAMMVHLAGIVDGRMHAAGPALLGSFTVPFVPVLSGVQIWKRTVLKK
jgi:hypothetical protein